MLTLSKIVVIGLAEAFAVLVLALIILLVFNHRLHNKEKKLRGQLNQLKETTRFLLEKLNSKEVAGGKHDFETIENAAPPALETFPEDSPVEVKKSNDETDAAINDVSSGLDEADLKQKWGYLCEAAITLVSQRTVQSADDLIDIVKVINTDLSMPDIVITQNAPKDEQFDKPDLSELKKSAAQNLSLISKLLSDKDAAVAEVSIKETELEQLRQYLHESETCLSMLEEELRTLNRQLEDNVDTQSDSEKEEIADMKDLIQRFTQESREMLMCIETLEQENAELKAKIEL